MLFLLLPTPNGAITCPTQAGDVLTTRVIAGVIREELSARGFVLMGWLPHCGDSGLSSSWYLLGSTQMAREAFGPKEAINFFPVNKREQALSGGLAASESRFCPGASSH